ATRPVGVHMAHPRRRRRRPRRRSRPPARSVNVGYPRSIARVLALRPPLPLPTWPSAGYPALLLIALSLPFEAIKPVVVTPWGSLTDDRLVLLVASVAWFLAGGRAMPTRAEWRALAPSIALIGVAVLAALLAPVQRADALRS